MSTIGAEGRLYAQYASNPVVDGIDKGVGQLPNALSQPGPIYQLQPKRHRDRVLRQTCSR